MLFRIHLHAARSQHYHCFGFLLPPERIIVLVSISLCVIYLMHTHSYTFIFCSTLLCAFAFEGRAKLDVLLIFMPIHTRLVLVHENCVFSLSIPA